MGDSLSYFDNLLTTENIFCVYIASSKYEVAWENLHNFGEFS